MASFYACMDTQAKMISISEVSSYLGAIQNVSLVIAHRVISFLLDAVSDCRLSIEDFCWLCIQIKSSSFGWTEQICVFRAKIIHFSSVTPICSAHLKKKTTDSDFSFTKSRKCHTNVKVHFHTKQEPMFICFLQQWGKHLIEQ